MKIKVKYCILLLLLSINYINASLFKGSVSYKITSNNAVTIPNISLTTEGSFENFLTSLSNNPPEADQEIGKAIGAFEELDKSGNFSNELISTFSFV